MRLERIGQVSERSACAPMLRLFLFRVFDLGLVAFHLDGMDSSRAAYLCQIICSVENIFSEASHCNSVVLARDWKSGCGDVLKENKVNVRFVCA